MHYLTTFAHAGHVHMEKEMAATHTITLPWLLLGVVLVIAAVVFVALRKRPAGEPVAATKSDK